jgi:hypothetical protein
VKCRLEQNWVNHTVKIWLYEEGGDGVYQHDLDGSHTRIPNGASLPEPTLELREDALQVLVAEASGILPPSDATTVHLRDAITVRDRLLTLVERGAVQQEARA